MVFIHVPKTGGYVIRQQPEVTTFVHDTAAQVLARGIRPQFMFAFVRNPYDRLVSAYHYYYQMDAKHPFWHLAADRQVAQAIRAYPTFQNFVRGFDTFTHRTRIHFLPQHRWLYTNGVPQVNYIGRFEQHATSWRTACELGGVLHRPLRHLNTSCHLPWAKYYDPDTKAIVQALFKEDFDYFDYRS